jgi:hypothetical protein
MADLILSLCADMSTTIGNRWMPYTLPPELRRKNLVDDCALVRGLLSACPRLRRLRLVMRPREADDEDRCAARR